MIKYIKKIGKKRISGKLIFIITGVASTIWFLVRVIPKPQRAYYPCMRAAAPIMSSFVIYLLSLSGSVFAFRKAKRKFFEAKYLAAFALLIASISFASVYFIKSSRNVLAAEIATGPSDGPNQPMGIAQGVIPGRVVWAWNPDATTGNPDDASITNYHFLAKYNNQSVYDSMFNKSILKLTESATIEESWDKLFKYHNNKKGIGDVGYISGEKIFIKINQVTAGYTTSASDGFSSFPTSPWDAWKIGAIGATQTTPYVVMSLLRQLVNDCGVAQSDIYIGDPIAHIFSHNYDVWHDEFPNINYIDKSTSTWGRTQINATTDTLIFYSDKGTVMSDAVGDKLFDVIKDADYFINVANLKAHLRAGFTGNSKNNFGSHSRSGASHLHPSLVAPEEGDQTDGPHPERITNSGYGKYRVLVDMMSNKYLGGNTVLFVIDGYWGSGYHDQQGPEKWKSSPFNTDWCNSLFISQDPVAIESVCYDFLRTEFDGVNQDYHNSPNWEGVDDYLHQAADSINWPEGISYAPNGDGVEIRSLGVHEHWNNPLYKQYTKNLFPDTLPEIGIELVSIPDTLVRGVVSIENSRIHGISNLSVFPNPVKVSTTISFYMYERDYVAISIYDMHGKLITHLLEKQLKIRGMHEFTWNVLNNNIKSGYYICLIQIGKTEYKRKISVIQ
ncbi:MAG: DUF362 domain-containing protein [Bacteroidales bacterium]|nr:DUF362 domain-containing protein [Bacteroidales bacterium]